MVQLQSEGKHRYVCFEFRMTLVGWVGHECVVVLEGTRGQTEFTDMVIAFR